MRPLAQPQPISQPQPAAGKRNVPGTARPRDRRTLTHARLRTPNVETCTSPLRSGAAPRSTPAPPTIGEAACAA